jgi:hypothetical protein
MTEPQSGSTSRLPLNAAWTHVSRHPVWSGVIASVVSGLLLLVITGTVRSCGSDDPSAQADIDDRSVTAAERVDACMGRHGLSSAKQISHADDEELGYDTTIALCSWPPAVGADADGYREITVRTVNGPGENEATGESWADRIAAPCPEVFLSYTFGKQGQFSHLPPLRAVPNSIMTVDGEPWDGSSIELRFYPQRNEIVVLHNSSYFLDDATCEAG